MVYILATTSGVAGTLAVPGGPWHLIFALGQLGIKSQFLHRTPMLGTLDFPGSEHWAPWNFS